METVKFIYYTSVIAPFTITVIAMFLFWLERQRFMKVKRENATKQMKIKILEEVLKYREKERKEDQRTIDSLEKVVHRQDRVLEEYRRAVNY